MFIGHYSAAFAARAVKPKIPLWQLFVAVQLVDFAWAVFVLAGIEKVRIVPGFMEGSQLDLYHMPYTHSLVGAVVWAVAAGALYAGVRKNGSKVMAGLIIAMAVFSHWLLDLIVHAPDLAMPDGEKVGFGLWQSLLWSQVLEVGLVIAAFLLYLRVTKPTGTFGRIFPWIGLFLLLAIQAYSHLPAEEVPTSSSFAVLALVAYAALAVIAWLIDRGRT
jgi:hypothetical protein